MSPRASCLYEHQQFSSSRICPLKILPAVLLASHLALHLPLLLLVRLLLPVALGLV